MDIALGIDVGGTSIKAGSFSLAGELLAENSTTTPDIDNDEAYKLVCDALHELVAATPVGDPYVCAIGLDVPGPVCEDGTVGFMPNANVDLDGLKAALRESFPDATLAVLNDANAAAVGELWQGGAAGESSAVVVTLGTGVGGGVIIDGAIVAGKHGAGGEIGHITVNPKETLTCGCGRKGCLEQYSSATGIVRLYQEECKKRGVPGVELTHKTDTRAVFAAYADGDECAHAAVSTMCDYLGLALSQIAAIIDPSMFVLSGGVSGAMDMFIDELIERYRAYALPLCAGTPFVAATLGNKAGMYGSAFEALRIRG